MRLQFVTVLLPHAPMRDASPLARGIEVLADRPGLAAVKIVQDGRCELAILNPRGAEVELDTNAAGKLATDARAVYIDLIGGKPQGVLVCFGRHLSIDREVLFRKAAPGDFSR